MRLNLAWTLVASVLGLNACADNTADDAQPTVEDALASSGPPPSEPAHDAAGVTDTIGDGAAAPDTPSTDEAEDLGEGPAVDADRIPIPVPDLGDAPPPDAATDASAPTDGPPELPAGEPRPIVFVHGIGGMSAEFEVMKGRLVADGWPEAWLRAVDYPDPQWGCNVDNAAFLGEAIDALREETGQAHVDLVAHSMGTLSTRYYLQRLGGNEVVASYVTLGGLHHGNNFACLNPLPVCVWQELCPTNPFLSDLNADPNAPGTPQAASICSRNDETATLETCRFDPVVNIEVDGPEHAGENGMLEHEVVYPELLRILRAR